MTEDRGQISALPPAKQTAGQIARRNCADLVFKMRVTECWAILSFVSSSSSCSCSRLLSRFQYWGPEDEDDDEHELNTQYWG